MEDSLFAGIEPGKHNVEFSSSGWSTSECSTSEYRQLYSRSAGSSSSRRYNRPQRSRCTGWSAGIGHSLGLYVDG